MSETILQDSAYYLSGGNNMNVLNKVAVISFIITITLPGTVFAREAKYEMKDVRGATDEIRNERKEFMQSMKNKVSSLLGFGKASIVNGRVTAKTDTSLSVEKDGKTYTVEFDTKIQYRRRFWGKSTFSEITVGNTVNVYGRWTDETKTTIKARLIRNISIQKRYGVFFGVVKSLTSDGWTMSTVNEKRPDQSVVIHSSTNLKNRREEIIVRSDIAVGHRIRVKGLWDKNANTITTVTEVKDFSLPVKPAGALTPTVTPTVTPTATLTPAVTPTVTPSPSPTP